ESCPNTQKRQRPKCLAHRALSAFVHLAYQGHPCPCRHYTCQRRPAPRLLRLLKPVLTSAPHLPKAPSAPHLAYQGALCSPQHLTSQGHPFCASPPKGVHAHVHVSATPAKGALHLACQGHLGSCSPQCLNCQGRPTFGSLPANGTLAYLNALPNKGAYSVLLAPCLIRVLAHLVSQGYPRLCSPWCLACLTRLRAYHLTCLGAYFPSLGAFPALAPPIASRSSRSTPSAQSPLLRLSSSHLVPSPPVSDAMLR
ncbi:unnamed protein product, partial [Ilex paraguariensis]